MACPASALRFQRLFEVGDDVFGGFNTHGKPHQIVADAEAPAMIRGEIAV